MKTEIGSNHIVVQISDPQLGLLLVQKYARNCMFHYSKIIYKSLNNYINIVVLTRIRYHTYFNKKYFDFKFS